MPIYEYKCENCDETFEVLQKFNDDPLTECVTCHQGPVKKLMSVSSFVLKGAGFYVNDYKKSTSSDTKSSKSTTKSSDSASSSTD
jgi:putative FmdB family regulatory protein